MTWVDSTGEYAAAKNKSFLDRLLGKGGFRPRLPPSSAEASVLAGAKVDTEDDVLHLRHLPDFGGALRASDVEYMLQALLAPYLRVPLLLRFFADPMRTSALAKPELQQMLDAALYEPGEWHPDVPKVAPTTVPTMDRSVLATPAGLLFNELTHSPAASVAAIVTIVENALDLDAGRYVKAGSSSAILYAIRLACRIEAFLTYLLSPKADEVRGLRMMSTADFGGVSPAKTKLLAAANTLRRKLMDHGLPVLQGWYARLRRDGMSRDACTVAAHMAFIYGDYPAVNDTPAAALKTEPLPGTPEAAAAAAAGEPCPVDARFTMMMLSTRVFLNVNHDFEIEPDVMTGLMGARTRKDRKRKVEVSAMMNTAMGELGYAPLDVFDLWQRHLHRVLAWLKANPEQASDIMEAIVRLLSGRDKGIKTQGGTRLVTREWASMKFTGCDGRYMPNSAATVANPARAAVARAGWGSENDAEADAAARSGGYVAWLRVKVSAAAETEINVQLGEMTLKRHHMQLLDASVCAHPDFAAVFGDTSTRGRHQCAEVKRSQRRRWMRLLGTRHDVQIWDADDRPPPSPGTALVSGLLAQWLEETLRPIKVAVPLLAHPEAPRLNLVEAHDTYAKLSVVVEGVLKELVIYRFPAVLNVFNVTEHGRKWVRELVYTSDTARCYGDPIAGGGFQGAVVRKPRPHWTAGDMAVRSEPQSTLVIMRQAANVQANAPNATQIFVPTRQLNGMMPEALLSQYLFWRDSAGQTLVGHPMPKGDEEQDYTGKVVAKAEAANAAGGASGAAAAGSPERPMPKGDSSQNQRLHLAGKEEVTVTCQRGGSVIRRTLCDEKGSPIAGESRRLISTLGVDASSPYGKMVALLERVEDLAHVLVWSLPQKEIVDTANNPFAKASQAIEAAATDTPSDSMAANPFASMAASVSKGVAAIAEQVQGPDSEVPVGLIELPRLNLAFEAKKGPDGLVRMYSRENPGLYIGTLEGPRASHLLSGLPHALVLLNEEGDASVLLSALAKPIRLADPDSALSAQMLLARASKKWLSNLPTVTHFLYSVHRSQAFLTPPTLSATLNLLVLKWLARDFEAVFHLAPACAVDGALSPDELQLWQCVMALEDDVEPEAHACRLRLSLATRSCAAMVAEINWTVPQQLALYLNKLQFIPASCQLAAPDELILLRDYGAELPETRARIAFLDAAIDATLAKEASANNPFMAGQMPAPTLQANYPARPKYVEFDVQMDAPALIMAPEALAGWQKKLSSMSYSRPDEETGLKALKVISDWLRPDVIRLDSDSKGFWLLYEMFTSSINLKILMDDSTFALGSLLLRLAAKGAGDELLPILRLMETNQAFANEMPKFKDTRSKGMITGTMFKGKAGKGMPEEIHKALTNLLPRLPGGGKFLEYPLYSPPQSVPMPALRDLRTIHRTWLNPTSLGFMQEQRPWFFAQGNSSGPPRLLTFEVDMGTGFGGQLPPVADLQARENLVKRLLAALEQLYKQDMKSADEQFPHVQALVIEGGASAPEAVRRARALAQLAGCELRPSMELLCALLMSTQAEAEIKVLNPLLSDAEVEQVFSALTALLLLYSRAQLLSRAIVLCKKLVDSLAALVREASRGGKPAPEALALAADAQAIGDQLGAMISTRRAHMQLPGASTPGAPAPTARLDPRILVFEFCAGIVLRPPQVHLLDKLVRCARSGGSVCHQMLMGEGKTTTVSPLLALMLADGTQLVMQVVPAPLLRFTLQVMRGVFRSGPLRKTVATFAFDRRTVVDENLLLAAHLAIQQGAIMVSTPASVKAFLLKLLELLHLLDTGQYPRMHMSLGQKARKLFGFKVPPEAGFDKPFLKAQAARAVQMLQYWRGAVAVIDEVDIVLHPLKSELNWPLGDRHPLDFNPTRWEMPWYLLNGLLMAVDWKNDASAASPTGTSGGTSVGGKEATVLERLHHAINTGLQQRVMQRVPHVILLSDMFYVNTLKPILADWLMLYLRKNGLRDVTDEQAIKCLLNGKITVQVQSALSDRHVKMLNLGCDWLGFLMPHVIRKISRVHYGLLKPQEMAKMKAEGGLPRSRRYLAVPFVGKDAPSHASEFAHPDVAIGLTILAYRYEGLRLLDFGPALQLLRQVLSEEAGPMLKRPSSIMKASKSIDLNKDGMVDSMERGHALDAVVGVDVSEGSTDILPLHLLDVSDVEYMAMLYELLSRKPEPIKFYLEELVFPDTTAHQPMKLSANGQDVGGAMLFSRRIGFSGTPSGLLPLEMGDCVYSMGDDAKMLKTLTDPLIVSQQFMPAAWDVPTLLEAVVAHQPPAHALIDTGALVTGMSNLDVAHFLLKRLPADKYDGVVYLEPGGHKKILLRGTAGASSTMDMERCGLPKERRFSFFDQVHTTGMDIPQGASACAILTLGKDMVWRDYAQGAYRMRGIGKGQTILLFVIPEVQRLMASETALGAGTTRDVRAAQIAALPEQERRRQELEAVASWLVINSMKSERVQFELWCLHCSQNVWRKKAKNGLVAGHANFSDAREGKGASALERRMLEVFREGVERDISNSVPVATDTRQTIASLAQQYAELCDEMHEIKAIESVQAMLAGYAPELDVPTESHTEKANEAAAFDQEQEQEQEQGHHRLKNIIAVMEWAPDVAAAAKSSSTYTGGAAGGGAAMAALTDGQRQRLSRVFQMYDAEGRGALGEQRLRTILSDMGLEPETVAAEKLAIEALFSSLRASGAMNCDPSNGELRVPSMEFLRVMQAQEFLVGEMGRYWVALSLREAETLRGALHAAMDGETALVPNSKVAVGLRIGDLLLDAVGGAKGDTDGRPDDYHQPPRLQLQSAVQAFRLIDCQHAFSHAQTRLLLRMLRADAPEDRKRWVVDTSACRRRPQARIENMRGSGLIQILTVEDEYHLLVHAAHVWRIKHELRRKQLGVHDIFFAFNQTRNGLLSCGELGAGLTWLGLPFGESELIALLKGLDKDTDGLLSLEEWSAGFPELPSSEPATQEKLAELELKPMRVKELYEGSVLKRLAIPVRPEALAKFKFKLKPHKSFTLVWSNKGSGALHDVSIWAPEIEARIEKKSHARVCFGHMPVSGFESPSKAGEPQLLEVTDTAVGMLASSESMSAVVDQLLPHPLRYRLAWHDAHAKPPLYIWRAVPPSADFVAVGMIATSSDDQPELTAMRCVPTRWLSAEKEEPKKVWQHGGQIGGRTGTFWSTNQLNVLLAMHGQEPPPKDQRWFFTTDRFMAEPNKLADLVPAPPPPEGTLASTSNPNVPNRSKTSFFGGKKEVAKPQAPSGMPIAAAANAAVKAPPAVDKAAEIANSPWPLSKDDYFGMWRAPNLKETQARITFYAAHEVSTIKAMLMNYVKLAVLEGVDPSPNNICAAGAIVCLNAPMPPAPGSHHCLLRIEIIPGYAKAPDGSPRAASRITARSTSPEAAEMLVGALAAYLG
ncbi:conserved unknown protein [Chrysochromulina tobinii]|uniref:ubiquitinyl hydrolase 1 n=1 Tax=Chrysochromulina tobinii TaxID=1460289 RepID=A0A0M0J8U3_9EUKA|nr:conserved unknown protein [Chrysochromulina tobinii]|eukprot:KOO22777.1 conserved unknown protein [Chrysochromulina sp. CCMP291]